jgi:hypothetical protein
MNESTLWQASTKVSDDTKDADEGPIKAVKHVVRLATAQGWPLVPGPFRILNALTIRTFFSPDEYFQLSRLSPLYSSQMQNLDGKASRGSPANHQQPFAALLFLGAHQSILLARLEASRQWLH